MCRDLNMKLMKGLHLPISCLSWRALTRETDVQGFIGAGGGIGSANFAFMGAGIFLSLSSTPTCCDMGV